MNWTPDNGSMEHKAIVALLLCLSITLGTIVGILLYGIFVDNDEPYKIISVEPASVQAAGGNLHIIAHVIRLRFCPYTVHSQIITPKGWAFGQAKTDYVTSEEQHEYQKLYGDILPLNYDMPPMAPGDAYILQRRVWDCNPVKPIIREYKFPFKVIP
jgi:hypothetical protein